ncbi:MAG: alpha-L-fucosidase [bacterium]|nr:alpha-L-fucosidase [bacterium]
MEGENTYLKDKYRQIFRNLTYPMRLKNFNPEKFIKFAKSIGAEVVVVDVRTQSYSLHETKVFVKDPVLGDRDLVRECVDICRNLGLKFVGYVAPLAFEIWWKKHPEWQQRRADGTKVETAHWKTWGCWNTGFGEFICRELKEITENYRPDGFYIDGLLIGDKGCYCEACRKKFKKEMGYDIPEKPDWNNKKWYEYMRWKYRQVEYFAEMISDAIHSIDPKIEIIYNCPYAWFSTWFGQSYLPAKYLDRVGTETYLPSSIRYSSQKNWSLITFTSYSVYVTRMLQEGKRSHCYTYIVPGSLEAEVITEINTILASGGVPCIQGCDVSIRRIMEEIKKTEPYLYESEQERCIGIVYSDITRDSYYKDIPTDDFISAYHKENYNPFFTQMHGLFKFFVEAHLPFQFIGDGQIEKGDLDGFKLLILPNVAALNEKGWENIKKYVEKGGKILATYKTGLFGIYGKSIGKELLWHNAGLFFRKQIKTEKPYLVDKKGNLQVNIPPEYNQYLLLTEEDIDNFNLDFSLLEDGGGWIEYEIPGYLDKNLHIPAEALEVNYSEEWEVILPFGYKEHPESKMEETVGIGKRKWGKGEIYYLNFDVGEVLHKGIPNLKKLLYSLIFKIASPLPVEVKAPASVFFSLWKQKKENRYVVHLVNELSPQGRPASKEEMRTEIIPVNLEILVNIPKVREIKKVLGEGDFIVNNGREVIINGLKERVVFTIKV